MEKRELVYSYTGLQAPQEEIDQFKKICRANGKKIAYELGVLITQYNQEYRLREEMADEYNGTTIK